MNGDGCGSQEVGAQLLPRAMFFFFFGEWVFRGNSLQSWHCPPEGGMYRNRAVEGEGMRECMCVCVCVNATQKVSTNEAKN